MTDTDQHDPKSYQKSDETSEHAGYRRRADALARTLLDKRDDAIAWRASTGIERQWFEDEKFLGSGALDQPDMLDYATGEAFNHGSTARAKPRRSTVVVNIVRGRVEVAEGRFNDTVLPIDDHPFGLSITPDPDLPHMLQDNRPAVQHRQRVTLADGTPARMADIAHDQRVRAKEAMERMQTVIRDQFAECDYAGEARKSNYQAAGLGTGILKGPIVKQQVKTAWVPKKNRETGKTVHILEKHVSLQPSSHHVDIWDVYPSRGTKSNIQKTCEYIWERDEILPRDVRALIGTDGWLSDQLKDILNEEPVINMATVVEQRGKTYTPSTATGKLGSAYEMWTYYGDLDKRDLEALGCDCTDLDSGRTSACVIFINDRPVKIERNILDSGELPYDFFQWSRGDTNTPWGIGVARQIIWLQRIIIAAWRAMMDNARDSSGSTVILKKGTTPASGILEIGGKQLYYADDNEEDVRKAFQQFQLVSNQDDLQKIIELALRFVDLETTMPTIWQGEGRTVPETLGQTNIMVNSSNIGIRQRVKLYDDRVTKPHVTRYYTYNMLYNPRPEIKGDFVAVPSGVKYLAEKDQQAQGIADIYALKQDPDFRILIDWDKAAEQLVKAKRLDILKSQEDLNAARSKEAEPREPQDPTIAAAQIRAETELEKARINAALAEGKMQHEGQMKKVDMKIKMMEFALKKDLSLDQVQKDVNKLKVQLAISGASLGLQRELSSGTIGSEIKQVATPPTEPAGRAPDGQAFER
jgi:hypothetical protein